MTDTPGLGWQLRCLLLPNPGRLGYTSEVVLTGPQGPRSSASVSSSVRRGWPCRLVALREGKRDGVPFLRLKSGPWGTLPFCVFLSLKLNKLCLNSSRGRGCLGFQRRKHVYGVPGPAGAEASARRQAWGPTWGCSLLGAAEAGRSALPVWRPARWMEHRAWQQGPSGRKSSCSPSRRK